MSTKVSTITKVKETPLEHPDGEASGQGNPQALAAAPTGLLVNSLRLDGIVRGPNGIVAVVSNPQQRVFFLREGDQLLDGKVERITMEAVAFHEVWKDAFGKPMERQVTKRLYPSAGEQP
jgi:Tfp pilus assembly protein PilP